MMEQAELARLMNIKEEEFNFDFEKDMSDFCDEK